MGCCCNQHQSNDAFVGLCCLKRAISTTKLQRGPFLLSLLTPCTIASMYLSFHLSESSLKFKGCVMLRLLPKVCSSASQ